MSTISARLRGEGSDGARSSVRRWIVANLAEQPPGVEATVPRGPCRRAGGADRLRQARDLDGSGTGSRHADLGVRDGAGVLADMFVRPVIRLDQTSWLKAMSKHSVLRRGAGPAGAGQLEDRGDRLNLYDPRINRAYAELAAHYGVIADPARAFKPKDKPRVERAMPYCGTRSGAAATFT